MNSEEFKNLYKQQDNDESITTFTNEIGFSLVRKYPSDTIYNKDNLRMFIKVAILDKGFFYEINMTKPEDKENTTSYIIIDGREYKRKVTNFFSDGEEFYFDIKSKTVIHSSTKKSFSLNKFVDILVKNHLSDRFFWKRVIGNKIVEYILKFIFWLSDKHYDRVKTAIDKLHFDQREVYSEEKNNYVDPFFKYFLISRNMLFISLILAFVIALTSIIYKIFDNFNVANPLVVIGFFLLLSFCEKISIWLKAKIKDFFVQERSYNRKENFIDRLHNFQYYNKFNLKID